MRMTEGMRKQGPQGEERVIELFVKFMVALEAFSESYRDLDVSSCSCNICEKCLLEKNLALADDVRDISAVGMCGRCGAISRVVDLDLLEFYRAMGVRSRAVVAEHLPALRIALPHRKMLPEAKILNAVADFLGSDLDAASQKRSER